MRGIESFTNYWTDLFLNSVDLSLTGDDGALLEPLGSILLESLRNELSEDLLVAMEPVLFFVQATPAKGLII